MKFFKYMVLNLSMALTLGHSFIQPANAGLIVTLANGGSNIGQSLLVSLTAGGVASGVLVMWDLSKQGGHPNFGETIPFYLGIGFGAGLLLDVDATLPQGVLETSFARQFPFVDNREALTALAVEVKSELAHQMSLNGGGQSMVVSLDREVVSSIFALADLTDEQLEQIQNELN